MKRTNDMKNRPAFDAFVASMHDDGALPPLAVVEHHYGVQRFYKNTGHIPVLREDESTQCPVFDNWGTYYEFQAWSEYRKMKNEPRQFQAMVVDVLDRKEWSADTINLISAIHALVKVQDEYAAKNGHAPVDITKFVKSCVQYGPETVMRNTY